MHLLYNKADDLSRVVRIVTEANEENEVYRVGQIRLSPENFRSGPS
jgi:hypothetical protein